MKVLCIAALVLAVAFAQSSGKISITKFTNTNCTGAIEHSYDLPTGQCVEGDSKKYPDFASLYFTCAAGAKACAEIEFVHEPNCPAAGKQFPVECDKCLMGPKDVGFYRYRCNARAKTAVAQRGCDSTCSTCKESHTLVEGQCHNFGNNTESVKLTNIGACPVTVTERAWKVPQCSGSPDHQFRIPTGSCDAGWVFNCTA